jgi:hypothetical protein
MTINEKKFLQIISDLNDEELKQFISFARKVSTCYKIFGDEYDNAIKPHIDAQDAKKLEDITNQYFWSIFADVEAI